MRLDVREGARCACERARSNERRVRTRVYVDVQTETARGALVCSEWCEMPAGRGMGALKGEKLQAVREGREGGQEMDGAEGARPGEERRASRSVLGGTSAQ